MANQAAPQPTHAEMIAEMQKANFSPSETTPQAVPEPTHDQMIKEMQGAGFTPGAAEGSGNSFLDAHPTLRGYVQGSINALPTAGAVALGAAGATAGSIIPGAGTAEGALLGTGAGAVVGSAAKDAINSWVFGATKTAGQVAKDAANEGSTAMLMQKGGDLALKGLGKVAEKIVPASVINKYSQAADAIKALWNNNDGDVAEAADQVKKGITTSLDEFRGQMNSKIKTALEDNTDIVKGGRILDSLKDYASKIDGDLYASDKAQVQELIDSVGKKIDQNGDIFVKDANSVKQFLQDKATQAYRMAGESGGGTELANAAKNAAATARQVVNEGAPEVAAANQKLATLHWIEDRMNKNIIRQLKPESGLVAAGKYSAGASGGSASNAKALKLLGDLTGNDFLGKAQELAAMKTFQGASLLQRGAGAGLGVAGGYALGEAADPEHAGMYAAAGGALGGAITSPAAVKSAIDIGRAFPGASNPISQTLGQAVMHGTGAASALRQVGQAQ